MKAEILSYPTPPVLVRRNISCQNHISCDVTPAICRDAWAAHVKMSKQEAMAHYVALVCAIDPEWNAAQRTEDVSALFSLPNPKKCIGYVAP